MEDGIELEGNLELPVKLTDNEAYQLGKDVNVTQKTSSLTDRQNEKYEPNSHKKIIKEEMGDRIELEGNVELPEKLLDNEAYQLGKDVNVTQQRSSLANRQNERYERIAYTRRTLEQRQRQRKEIMAKYIHQSQQENVNMKCNMDIKVQHLEEKSNEVHELQEQSINMQNEMQELREENKNLKGKIQRVKEEINYYPEENQHLQQQNTNMESDMNVKVGQLEEKFKKIHKLQEGSITMQNEMQGLREGLHEHCQHLVVQ